MGDHHCKLPYGSTDETTRRRYTPASKERECLSGCASERLVRRQLRLTALGDLYISGRPEASHYRDTQPRIPGSQIRGVFASKWIDQYGPPQTATPQHTDDFIALFHGPIRWGSVFPIEGYTVPLSSMVHKAGRPAGCLATPEQLDRTVSPDLNMARKCPSCDGPLDDGKGDAVPQTLLRERTRVGLTPSGNRREKAEEGMLFTRQALAKGTELTGWVFGSHRWLDQIETPFEARLGGQRSVDGRVRVELDDPVKRPTLPVPDSGPIVLRATSPAVFVDRCGRPSVDPPLSEIGFGPDATVVNRWVRIDSVGGWDAVAGLPRPEDTAVAAGSTWVIGCDATPERLADLLNEGIGLRREVGYGDLIVNPEPWTEPHQGAPEQFVGLQPVTNAFTTLRDKIPPDKRSANQVAKHLRSTALAQLGRTGYTEEIGSGRTFDRFPAETQNALTGDVVRLLNPDQKKQLADVIEAWALDPTVADSLPSGQP